jgi:uncharacterized protein (DUF488 family)
MSPIPKPHSLAASVFAARSIRVDCSPVWRRHFFHLVLHALGQRAWHDLQAMRIWTIGHSTHSIEHFIAVLQSHGIRLVADVRRFPGSRRYPHFNREAMQQELGKVGIDYLHVPELGGRRKPAKDSPNTIWRHESFRGYADYMETDAFRDAVSDLMKAAEHHPAAIMCAEALWWRCHRALIADYLKTQGVEVIHILSAGDTEPHPYTSAARIVNRKLTYHQLL